MIGRLHELAINVPFEVASGSDNHEPTQVIAQVYASGLGLPDREGLSRVAVNEIVFPAGILQPPAFSMQATDAVNYGAIGVVIGHEISHGFDDQGAQYDAQGRLSNWWTEGDLKKFQAIGKYRVIEPLSNLPEFQQAFACPADAPMVRPAAKRCDVW